MKARATVIIPTYGNALFARWAIKSVQQQTVRDIEICIICDGSPQEMVDFFKAMAKEDGRIQVHVFEKSPRTGEPYRDIVIGQTTGDIICYCAHDDLWLGFHIESVEKTLQHCAFTHSIHAFVDLPENIKKGKPILGGAHWMDIRNPRIVKTMLDCQNYFGLTYGAHRRDSYKTLRQGWTTTPPGIATDLYMWRKFLSAFEGQCKTTRKVTALNFQKVLREDWSEQARADELKEYFETMQDPAFLKVIHRQSLIFAPLFPSFFQKTKFRLYSKMRRLNQIVENRFR